MSNEIANAAISDMQKLRAGMDSLRLNIAANQAAIRHWGGNPSYAIETRMAERRIERARGELAVLVAEADDILAMHEENAATA